MKRALWLAIALAGCAPAPRPSAPHPMVGKPLSLDLPSDSGKLVAVPWEGPRGYVLEFWGPTCKPCRKKLPALVARKRELETKGVSLVLIAVLEASEPAEEARAVLASWGVREPFLVSDGEAAWSRAGVASLPATMVLDERGWLRWVAPDDARADDIIDALP